MSGAGRVPGPPPSAGAGVPVHGTLPRSSVCPVWCLQSNVFVCDQSSIFIAIGQTEKRGVSGSEKEWVLYKIYL